MRSIDIQAEVSSQSIGMDTRIDAFCVVKPGAIVGANCHLGSHSFVDDHVILGDQVTLAPGAYLCSGTELGNGVKIGPNVSFSERSAINRNEHAALGDITHCRDGVCIGAGATILSGVTIGERAVVEAGTLLARSVPPNAIVAGNPARIVGYVDAQGKKLLAHGERGDLVLGPSPTRVNGVNLHRMPYITDLRGDLTVGEFGRTVPFMPKRYFLVLGVPDAELRGEHAHKTCDEFLVCVAGRISVVADDGCNRQEFVMDRNDVGLYLPAMTWVIHYNYTEDAVLAVFCSDYYDDADYIRDYKQFLALKAAGAPDARLPAPAHGHDAGGSSA